jgi:transcription elongation GreA/GreB family factor
MIEDFRKNPLLPSKRVALGAVVEVEDEAQGRTFFLAPVGAGMELTGPDGDGILSVVTPQSPVGRAVLGRSVGDTVEVVVAGEPREWTITYVA